MKPEIIHPKVHVYRGAIKESSAIVEYLRTLSTWNKWWIFGEILSQVPGVPNASWDKFPSRTEWDSHIQRILSENNNSQFSQVVSSIENYFYEATKDYVETYSINLDNWMHEIPSFNVYHPNPEDQPGSLTMSYHTDYQKEKEDARGHKFKITCTMYLNDDYEGGGLSFVYTEDPTDPTKYQKFDYQPTKGDILVFPSGENYYHGVKKLISGDRYIVRTFWHEYFPGTPEWLAGEAEHGVEAWAEMEKEREARIREGLGGIVDEDGGR